MATNLEVGFAEEGLKLINFLLRNLDNDKSELYRWIKTGQVRINSKRATAQSKVAKADLIRLPPYATFKLCLSESSSTQDNYSQNLVYPSDKKNFIEKIYENEHLLVINKNADLACQGGSGQEMDLTKILKYNYPSTNFTPAPVHRLDKQTTGLVLVGKTYQALRYLSDFMQLENYPPRTLHPHKEYLALVTQVNKGDLHRLEENQTFYLIHYLFQPAQTHKVMALTLREVLNLKDIALSSSERQTIKNILKNNLDKTNLEFKNLPIKFEYKGQVAKIALSQVTCLQKIEKQGLFLLKVGIFTGRKHQIRAQCAKFGLPLLGDYKYNGKKAEKLYLHAYALHLNPNELTGEFSFCCLPPWQNEFELSENSFKDLRKG